jgi:hypothetical protein
MHAGITARTFWSVVLFFCGTTRVKPIHPKRRISVMSRKFKSSNRLSCDELYGSFAIEPNSEVRELSMEELDELSQLLED